MAQIINAYATENEGADCMTFCRIIFHFHKNTNKSVKAKVKPPFHGTMLDRDTADVVDTACKCGASSEMASGMNVDNSADGEAGGSSENRVAGELTCRCHKLLKSVFDESHEETVKIVHVGEKARNPQSFELDSSVGGGSQVCDDLKSERLTCLSPCKELQLSGKFIYQLKMFSLACVAGVIGEGEGERGSREKMRGTGERGGGTPATRTPFDSFPPNDFQLFKLPYPSITVISSTNQNQARVSLHD